MEAFVLLTSLFLHLCLSPWDFALLSTGQEDQCRPSTLPAAFPEEQAAFSPVGNQWRINGIVSLFRRQKLRGSALHVEVFTVQFRALHYSTKHLVHKCYSTNQTPVKARTLWKLLISSLNLQWNFLSRSPWSAAQWHIMGSQEPRTHLTTSPTKRCASTCLSRWSVPHHCCTNTFMQSYSGGSLKAGQSCCN